MNYKLFQFINYYRDRRKKWINDFLLREKKEEKNKKRKEDTKQITIYFFFSKNFPHALFTHFLPQHNTESILSGINNI